MSKRFILLAIIVIGAVAYFVSRSAPDETEMKPGTCCQTPNPGALVVPADQFVGETAASYAAAKEIPEICCQLFCYCGCDQVDNHTTLLECFISDHSNDCPSCRAEVLDALRLKKEGKTIAQIQKYVDAKYEKEYPFQERPSEALQKYRAKAHLNVPPSAGP